VVEVQYDSGNQGLHEDSLIFELLAVDNVAATNTNLLVSGLVLVYRRASTVCDDQLQP
jgi:hypothetical protein